MFSPKAKGFDIFDEPTVGEDLLRQNDVDMKQREGMKDAWQRMQTIMRMRKAELLGLLCGTSNESIALGLRILGMPLDEDAIWALLHLRTRSTFPHFAEKQVNEQMLSELSECLHKFSIKTAIQELRRYAEYLLECYWDDPFMRKTSIYQN